MTFQEVHSRLEKGSLSYSELRTFIRGCRDAEVIVQLSRNKDPDVRDLAIMNAPKEACSEKLVGEMLSRGYWRKLYQRGLLPDDLTKMDQAARMGLWTSVRTAIQRKDWSDVESLAEEFGLYGERGGRFFPDEWRAMINSINSGVFRTYDMSGTQQMHVYPEGARALSRLMRSWLKVGGLTAEILERLLENGTDVLSRALPGKSVTSSRRLFQLTLYRHPAWSVKKSLKQNLMRGQIDAVPLFLWKEFREWDREQDYLTNWAGAEALRLMVLSEERRGEEKRRLWQKLAKENEIQAAKVLLRLSELDELWVREEGEVLLRSELREVRVLAAQTVAAFPVCDKGESIKR